MQLHDRFEALLTAEGQGRLLIDAITDYAIYMLDTTGVVSSWNAGAERIKGYRATEIIGQNFARFYNDKDQQEGLPARSLRTAALDGRFEAQGWRVRKDGSEFWANVIIDPIWNNGKHVGFVKITRDITDKRANRLVIEQMRAEMFESQKLEMVGKLAGGVAHDFNNLLTAILGNLEIVQRRLPEDPKITPFLTNARRAALHGTDIVRQILSFAKQKTLNPVIIDIPIFVAELTNLFEVTLGPSITLILNFPQSVQVFADHGELELVLLNLMINARDAMPTGGSITISTHFSSDHKLVGLAVTDDGEGMDEQTLRRATEPFFTTKGARGTGLGLAMAHGFANQSGGKLSMTSERGKGTVVEIWLPIADKN